MRFLQAAVEDLGNRELRGLIAPALYKPDDAKVDAFLGKVDGIGAVMYLAVDDGAFVGQLTVSAGSDRGTTIRSIAVREGGRRRGIGRFLIQEFLKKFPDRVLIAETDDGAVGFYHAVGFRIRSLGEKYPGIVRYDCLYDPNDFAPLPYREAVERLRIAGVACWVAGGWALDLFHGRRTREHEDTDILIRREDQRKLFDAFPGWEVFRTHAPGLGLWKGDPYLDRTTNAWMRESIDSPWGLEVMFLDVRDGEWIYRRNGAVRGRIEDMGLVTADGIPYLRPEIQLLYKGGSSARRNKDDGDLAAILPILPEASRAWLANALRTQFPGGHDWLARLEAPEGTHDDG